MNNHMSLKLVGTNSSLELNSPISSIYLQEELEGLTTLPGIRETKGMNIGMDGGWTSAQFYEPRLITIKGVIANKDVAVVEQRRKQFIQLLAEKRLALEFRTEAGNLYTMQVVVAGLQMPLSKVLTATYFQLNLRADDPLIYDNNALEELEAILRRSSSASSGFTINFPINFQLGSSDSRPTIDNFGSSVIYPIITLTGPLTVPEVVNITTNMAFTIDEVLGAGTYTASGIRGAMTQEGSIDTYSGNPIQVTRDAESPISKFSLYGNATQETLSGKNLLSITQSSTINMGTYVSGANTNEYKIKATGNDIFVNTANVVGATWDSSRGNLIPCNYGETIYFSVGNTNFVKNYFTEWDENKVSLGYTLVSSSSGTYTPTKQGCKYVNFRFGNGYSVVDTTYTLSPIVCKTSDTSFEPYCGGVPSPNPSYPQDVNVVTGAQEVQIVGKNYFGGLTYKEKGNIASYTLDGMSLTITPSSATSAMYIGFYLGSFIPKAEVHLSGNTFGAVIVLRDTDNTNVANFGNTDSTKTLTGVADRVFLNFQPTGNTNPFTVNLGTLQIELGNQATDYEPYHGQSQIINLGGTNLIDTRNLSDTTTGGVTTTWTNNVGTANGTTTTTSFLATGDITQAIPAGTYTFSVQTAIPYRFVFALWNPNTSAWVGSYISANQTSVNFTTNFDATRWRIGVASISAGTTVSNLKIDRPMLQKGSQATTYVPYTTYAYELAKISNYTDGIYPSNGKWYIHKEVGKAVLDGSEAWANLSNSSSVFYIDGKILDFSRSDNIPMSDYFAGATNAAGNAGARALPDNTMAFITTETPNRLYLRASQFNNVANDFKTWLSTHNTTVYYALETPTDTEITDSELVEQLDAMLEAYLYAGENNVSNVTVGLNLAGDLEIKTGQILTVVNSLSIVGSSSTVEINLNGSELAMVGSVADELTINGTTGAVTKTARIGKIASYAGESITTDYISTSGGLDGGATVYYVLPSSSTSVLSTLDSTGRAAFNNAVASGNVSAHTNIGNISVDVTTVTAQDVAVVDTKQHTVTINGVGAYSKFSGDWLTLAVGLNELQLITDSNTDTGSAVIKYRVGYMGV